MSNNRYERRYCLWYSRSKALLERDPTRFKSLCVKGREDRRLMPVIMRWKNKGS